MPSERRLICMPWSRESPITSLKGECILCHVPIRYDAKNAPMIDSGQYDTICIKCMVDHVTDEDQIGGALIGGHLHDTLPKAKAALEERKAECAPNRKEDA